MLTRKLVSHISATMELRKMKPQMSSKTLAEDRPGREGARVAIGQTQGGRYLRVIYVPEPGGAFVITAYELTGKPLIAYRRRRRRKGKR